MSDVPAAPPPAPAASHRLITAACVLGLVGIGFTLAHFIRPTPLLFALFMFFGQGSLGMALLLYAVAIFKDLKRKQVL